MCFRLTLPNCDRSWRVIDLVVVNASPLIFLARGGHLELLRQLTRHTFVPQPVANEIQARGDTDRTVQALSLCKWIEIVNSPPIPAEVQSWGLGLGESSVLALAQQHPSTTVVMDDLAGRRCATSMGLPVLGTLGIILKARQKGLIPLARPIMEDLMRGGMYLSRNLMTQVLQLVGE